MVISDRPWSAKGHNLLDSYGNTIATFSNEDDLDYVLQCVKQIKTFSKKVDELLVQVEELQTSVPEHVE